MRRAIIVLFVLFVICLFALSACSSLTGKAADSDLSEIDKEIKALQDELKKSEVLSDELGKEDGDIEETTEKVVDIDDLKLDSDKKPVVNTKNLPKLEVMETELVKLKVEAKDADKDSIIYTFSRPLDARGQWKTDYGDAGEYVVTVTASDKSLKTAKDVLVIVKKKNEAPVIKGVSDISVTEGQTVHLKPVVTDVNKDDITVRISDPVGEDGVWETGYNDAGKHRVTISASDGTLRANETVLVTVIDKNMPPELKGLEDITVKEGELVKIKPTVTDLDKDKIVLTISDPVGDDGVWQTGYTDNGEYKITVKASDSKDTTTKVINLIVKDVNLAPEILSIILG